MKTLVLCPLKFELRAFLQKIKSLGLTLDKIDQPLLKLYSLPHLDVVVGTGGHGKVNFGLTTQRLLLHNNSINQVFCLGSAGSLSENLKPRDVVIAKTTVEHDYKQLFSNDNKHQPRFKGSITQQDFQNISLSTDQGFRLHYTTVASGDEDIVCSKRAQEIKQLTGAEAVAWEGAGGAKACKQLNIPFCEIRGISDNADQATAEAFKQNLSAAVENATEILLRYLKTQSIKKNPLKKNL